MTTKEVTMTTRKSQNKARPQEDIQPSVVVTNGTGPTVAPDPFDVDALRLDQSFVQSAGVRKLVTTIPVRKPNPQDWIRVHPDGSYRVTCALIELKDSREHFLLRPEMAHELETELYRAVIYTVINRQGTVHLWPIRIPAPDGRANEWHVSGHSAAEMAMTTWIRVKANMNLRANEIETTINPIPDPTWPDLPFKELLRIAFKNGRLIDNLDHPVVRQLRGF
jgi:hypothetical protein